MSGDPLATYVERLIERHFAFDQAAALLQFGIEIGKRQAPTEELKDVRDEVATPPR